MRAALMVFALVGVAPADVPEQRDEERSAWAYRRSVAPSAPGPGAAAFAELPVPPELMARSRPDLRDLRLVGEDGREVPYVVEARVERETSERWSGTLADVRREAKLRSVWTVDLGASRTFDRVVLTIPGGGFVKRVQADVSADGTSWSMVLADAGVFDRPWSPAIHHTTLDLSQPTSARLVRLTLDDRRSRPVDVTAVAVEWVRRRPGEEWRRPAPLSPLPGRAGVSRYRVEAPPGLAFEALRLESDDPGFSRSVSLVEALERNGRRQERTLGSDVLYRLRLPEEDLAAESAMLRVGSVEGGERILEVHDGDSPPLLRPRAEISGPVQRLVFPAASQLTLYYGNDATRAPLYDLASLRDLLAASGSLASATLGPESENPRFRKAPPLPFAALRGAELPTGRWSRVRPIAVAGSEDLYSLTLDALDLGALRRDLGDLRIVDDADRQLPYILEADASERRVELQAERDPSADRRHETRTSRYRLTPAGSAPEQAPALPLRVLELELDLGFFSRAARVLTPARRPREREHVVFSGTLARGAGTSAPLRIALDGSPLSALWLEIDEGDNEPLALKRASGVVSVPRVVFKAAAGRYRLLIGNPDAAPPRYDLASLRGEVLSYSAVVVRAAAAEDNPAYRRRPWERLREAPPTLVLWSALGGAVIALLLLTTRILRQPQV